MRLSSFKRVEEQDANFIHDVEADVKQ